jgi:hypothetical protein
MLNIKNINKMIEVRKKYGGEKIGEIENPSIEDIQKVIAEHIKSLVVADVEVAHVDETNFNSEDLYGELVVVLENGFQMVYEVDITSNRKLFGRNYVVGSDGTDYCESICIAIKDDQFSVDDIKEILDKENIFYSFHDAEDWDLEDEFEDSQILVIEIGHDEIVNLLIHLMNSLK